MIKVKNGVLQAKGSDSELLSDLAVIISALITKTQIKEEMIDITVGLGKASAKGESTLKEYMHDKLKEVLLKKTEKTEVTEMGIDIEGLLKQIKEEKEENED